MYNSTYILEGINSIENPLVADIKQELTYLQNKRIDFVLIRTEQDYIQCSRDAKHRGYFIVEANIISITKGELFRYNQPVSFSKTVELFRYFLKQGTISFDENWQLAETCSLKKKKGQSFVILFVLAAVVLIATSLAANASNRNWYEGFIVGLLAVVYLFTLGSFMPAYFKKAYQQTIKKSIEMGMPCEIRIRGRIRVLDKNKKDNKKLARLEIFLLGRILIGIVYIFAILGVFIGIGYLLQKYMIV